MDPATITIMIEDTPIEVRKGERLLEADDRIGLPIEFGCRGGACGTCIVEVIDGMENLGEKTDEEEAILPLIVDEGDTRSRLACQVRIQGPVHLKQTRRYV